MSEGILAAVVASLLIALVIALFWTAYNVAAIRRMLENQGLFSGIPCRWCGMPIPDGVTVCGHCGRDLGATAS